jgi:hypothetical protein
MAKLLMCAGIDVNVSGDGEGMPIHYAAASGNLELVRFLLKNGADFQARDGLGFTPKEYVSVCWKIAVVNQDNEGEAALLRVRDELIGWEKKSDRMAGAEASSPCPSGTAKGGWLPP